MSTAPPTDDLRQFLTDAQARHGAQSAQVWAALQRWAPHLAADDAAAEALRLAEHVGLGHCADVPGLQAFVQSLPAALARADATAVLVQRLQWCLQACAGGITTPELPRGQAWRALQNVVLALARQGRCAEAGSLLVADEALALAEGPSDSGKAYAASANNIASHLQTDRHAAMAERDALMLQAAAAARRAWVSAGNWMHVERADYRLALCHALVGDGASAVQHAQHCLAACVAAGEAADALEHFFAHEALVRAYRVHADVAAEAAALQRMQTLLAQITEADGLRAWCAQTLTGLTA